MTLCKGDKLAKVVLEKALIGDAEEYRLVSEEAYHLWEIVDLSSPYGSSTEVFQIVILKKIK